MITEVILLLYLLQFTSAFKAGFELVRSNPKLRAEIAITKHCELLTGKLLEKFQSPDRIEAEVIFPIYAPFDMEFEEIKNICMGQLQFTTKLNQWSVEPIVVHHKGNSRVHCENINDNEDSFLFKTSTLSRYSNISCRSVTGDDGIYYTTGIRIRFIE